MFGDFEPEDAWHPDDPPSVLARNLLRRLEQIAATVAARGERGGERELFRLEQLADDLEHLRRKLER